MLRMLAIFALAAQLLLVPWKQTRVFAFDDVGDITTTTVYRPIFLPPHPSMRPEIDLLRLGYQLLVTTVLIWAVIRLRRGNPGLNAGSAEMGRR